MRLLADSDPDADLIVLVPAPRDLTAERIRAIRRVPVVVAGSILPGLPSVGVDDVAAGEKATNHLVNLGATRVAYVCRSDHDGTSASRPRTGGRGIAGPWRGSGWPPGRSRSRSARAPAERRPRRCSPPISCPPGSSALPTSWPQR
ncbi:MAG: hypothetical protein KDB41_03640 [Propionibacteriaceae bacterium]|nr:hypothetical protein [Propionibacteriaceae bacterium]